MKSLKESLLGPCVGLQLRNIDLITSDKIKLVVCEVKEGNTSNLNLGVDGYVDSFFLLNVKDKYSYYTGNFAHQLKALPIIQKYTTETPKLLKKNFRLREYQHAATRYNNYIIMDVYAIEIDGDQFKKMMREYGSSLLIKAVRGYSTADVRDFIKKLKEDEYL